MITRVIIDITSAHANPDLCTPCGGQCCKHMPGICLPQDLSPTLDETEIFVNLSDRLKTGRWVIDDHLWSKFIRPAVKGEVGRIRGFDQGPCTFLSETGCELSEVERPSECKLLKPHPKKLGYCQMPEAWGWETKDMIWEPYQHLIDQL